MRKTYQHIQTSENLKKHHRRTLVPPCVNGDDAIQWEWSNFDPSQNPNP